MRFHFTISAVSMMAFLLSPACVLADGEPLPPGALVRLGSTKFRLPLGAAAIAFSPDSKHILSGDNQGTIQVWDLATGRAVHSWKLSQFNVGFLRYSPDGKKLAASFADGAVNILEVQTGRSVISRNDGRYDQAIFAWVPDSPSLLMCRRNGRVQVIDVEGRKPDKTWPTPVAGAAGIACLPDGKTAILQSFDGSVRGFDLETGKETITFEKVTSNFSRAPGRVVSSLVASPDGKHLIGMGGNRPITVWDLKTGKIARRFDFPSQQPMFNSAISGNGRFLAGAMQDGNVRIWGLLSGEEMRTLEIGALGAATMAFSPDGRLFAAVVGQTLRVWDLTTGKDLHDDAGHRGNVMAATFLENATKLVTMGQDMTLRYWDIAAGKELGVVRLPQNGGQFLATDSTDKAALVSVGGLGIRRWSPATAMELDAVPLAPAIQNTYFQFSSDGRFAASNQNDNELVMIDTTDGKEVHRLNMAGRIGYNPQPSAQGRYLAYFSSYIPGTVYVWDCAAGFGKRPLVVDGPNRGASRMAYSRDGRILAVQTHVGIVQIYEIATSASIGQITSPDGYNIMTMALSPNGRTVALANAAGAIRLFDVASKKSAGPFQAHSSYIQTMSFSADGSRLVTGGMDTTAVVWDVARLTESFPHLEKGAGAPTAKQIDDWWNDLSSTDVRTLWPAIDQLAAAPNSTIPFLREKLKPEPTLDSVQIARWLADLGSPRFSERDQATQALTALGGRVGAALTAELRRGPLPEARRRIEAMLAILREGISTTQFRPLRAIEVLERIGTPESRQILKTYASQTGEDDLKREAEFALKRMGK